MTLREIQDAGIQLQPGDYVGRRFEMVLSVGSQQVSLNVPVVTPVYDGLETLPRSNGPASGLQLGNITGTTLPPGLSIVMANLSPEEDPFSLSRPSLSFAMRHGFKALLVIPGSIGYLKQIYKVNVVVFNALEEGSPFKVTHLSAKWAPPAGLDGQVGTSDDPLQPTAGEDLTQPMIGPSGQAPIIAAGESAVATFDVVGNQEGGHPLDFEITGQFEGGDLQQPVAIKGTAHGKVLVQNPNFSLMLVHPDVVRRGQSYTLEAHLTNTSQTLANAVSLTIDKARLAGAQLLSDATQGVDTLMPGQTAVMKFEMRAFISGQVTSSYLYVDPGGQIGFQLSTGIGPRSVALNPDTLVLPDSLTDPVHGISKPLQEAMLGVLSAAYDVATSQKALPTGVLPISRGAITTTLAQSLSEEGLFLGMGIDKARVWWDLWRLFTQNTDPGFDQLMRTTQAGANFRNALLAEWPWADASRGPAARTKDLATFNAGLRDLALIGIEGAGQGLVVNLVDEKGTTLQARIPVSSGELAANPIPLPTLSVRGAAWGAAGDFQLLQYPMTSTGTVRVVLTNLGQDAQALTLGIVNPVSGQAAPTSNLLSFTLDKGMSATLTLGSSRQLMAKLTSATGSLLGNAASTGTADAPAEPFQVLGVHRYDLSVSGSADPYGTQVSILFNRPNKALQISAGEEGFNAASALIQVEANQFWRKVLPRDPDTGTVPPSPAALLQTYPRVVSCYLEKPVGPYVQRNLTLAPLWTDLDGNPIQGNLRWPIQSGLLPGGAIVKGRFRKLDGTGVAGALTYWYYQAVNSEARDLETGISFNEMDVQSYYALVTNNVATDADGSYQLDFVPDPIGDYLGPFVLQGGFAGGTAWAEASILGDGQTIQMDLVLEGQGSVDGYVLDAQSQPIAGAAVMALQQQRSSNFTQGTGGGSFRVAGVTDATGHYHLDGLKTGVFSLQVLKDQLGAVSGGQIIADGQRVGLNVILQGKTGVIKARVLDTHGNVRLDQPVRLGIPAGLVRGGSGISAWAYPVEAKPGADGWATFVQVPAGDVRLRAPYSAPTPASDWQGFLNPDRTLQVELKMIDPSQLATLRAHVVDVTGQPVSGAYLKLSGRDSYVAQTGEEGYTAFVQVPPDGTVTGSIYHPNWAGLATTNSVMLQPGGNYLLQAVMPARCAISGRVTRPDGTPVAGAYVAVPPVYSDNYKNRLGITNAAGFYSIPNVATGGAYRLTAVGPELLTAVSAQVPIAATDTTLTANLTLPAVAHNTLTGTAYQPLNGNGEWIPSNATVQVYGQLPSLGAGDEGNRDWGLPERVLVGSVSESDMPPTAPGRFSIPNLPAGPYALTASSSLFPSLVTMAGDFGSSTSATKSLSVFLKDNHVGLVQGKVLLPDGQTPVAAGARVMIVAGGSQPMVQVLTQAGGAYTFPKVIPPGSYALRAEDPQTGAIAILPFSLGDQEIKTLNARLWGTGGLSVKVQDSNGNPILCPGAATCGTVTLQHSKSGVVTAADMPVLKLPLTPADQGTLTFPHLQEGQISVQFKDSAGLVGMASTEIPVGGGDRTVVVRLQPVGGIQGTLLRADGTPVAAGRVDAYQGGRWLGTAPTSMQFPIDPGPVPGHFMFGDLPTGAIRLEAWDPDSRQVGQATVNVVADQYVPVTMNTLDTGSVTFTVLQEGQPVLRAGLQVSYQGGPALSFTTEATADENGQATFTLPPGTYSAQATDPVSLASGKITFTRTLNAPPFVETIALQPVRSIFVKVLPPAPAPGSSSPGLAGWMVATAGQINRTVVLDSNGEGTLQEMPVGTYFLSLVDTQGGARGRQPFQVTADGGPLQMAQIAATAIGTLKVTVTDPAGRPVPGATVNWGLGAGLLTDGSGQATFYGVPQGSWNVSASLGNQRASGSFSLTLEGEQALSSVAFAPTAALHGSVRDAEGRPAPFVAVSCGGAVPDSATDGTGAYAFRDLPTGKTLTVTATTGQGRMGVSAPVTLAPGDDLQVDLSLASMGTLAGRVTDALRPALPSLDVRVLSASGATLASSSTDQTGAFSFPNLPAGQPLGLRVIWDDQRTVALQQSFSIPGEGQTATLALPLPPFVNIAGLTLDASGANLPLHVELKDSLGNALGSATTTPDIPAFSFRYLEAGRTFQLEGFDPATGEPLALMFVVPLGQSREEYHALQAALRPSVKLQLTYPDGTPAPGSGVTAHITGIGGLANGLSRDLSFDGAGTATLASMPPGTVRMNVQGLVWQNPVTLEIVIPAQGGEVAVPVVGTGTLKVRLYTVLAPGHDVSQASVTYLRNGQAHPMSLESDGSFQVQVPTQEPLSVRVTEYVTGKALTQVFGAIAQNGASAVNMFGVPALGRIHGRILGADGQPRSGVPVQLIDGGAVIQAVSSGAGGAYAFDGVEVAEPLTLIAQDPVVAPISASVALTQEGQDRVQDLTLKGFAALTVHALQGDGSDAVGIPVSVTGSRVALQGTSDGTGRAMFAQVLPDTLLTVTAQFASGAVSREMTLSSLQAISLDLKETPKTRLLGRARRQMDGQTWPLGTSLVVTGGGNASLSLDPDGTFVDQELSLVAAGGLQFAVHVPGLVIPLPGTVTAQVGGQTLIDLRAPAFGSLQAEVVLSGQPVSQVNVRLDSTIAQTTDSQGLTPVAYVLTGAHRYQATAPGGMAWADASVQVDGQSQVIRLSLQDNAVGLPAAFTLERLGLSVNPASASWVPALSFGLDGAPLAALTPPPQGYWVNPGSSLAWEMDQGDIHVTRIASSAGYGMRDQLIFENRGTMAHALRLGAKVGTLRGDDPQLGSAAQSGGAWFNGCTVAWGRGTWVPTGMTASLWYSGNDTLLWPLLTLQPGQAHSIWLGYVPHGQSGISISSHDNQQAVVPDSPSSAGRALSRMVGQAPEWMQDLDPRLSNGDPLPTVTDPLPPWNGWASLNLLDPLGQPVQALGVASTTVMVTPNEALAPIIKVDWHVGTRSFAIPLQQVPPDGAAYAIPFTTPLHGSLVPGQSLDLQLGAGWAVVQGTTSDYQVGNHSVQLRDSEQVWSAWETLNAGVGLRWTTPSTSVIWAATQQNNSNLQASGTAALVSEALTPLLIRFPAYGSLIVQGPESLASYLGTSGYGLTATVGGASTSSGAWTNGTFIFPALPVGRAQIQGAWHLGSAEVQEGVTTTWAVDVGSVEITALDVNGVPLNTFFTLSLNDGSTSNSYSGSSNPRTIGDLPVGTYTVGLQDPVSGAVVTAPVTVSRGSMTPVVLRLAQNGSLSVTLQTWDGAEVPNVGITATPSGGGARTVVTDAHGFAHFVNVGTGTASLTYGSVPGADANDQPGKSPTLVALAPGSDVPVTLTVPHLGAIAVAGVTQAGDPLPSDSYSIPNAFIAGRRMSYTGSFQGVVLSQPLVVRFGDGSSHPTVDALPATPTVDGQTVALTFPLGRLRVRVRHQDHSPIPNIPVVLSIPGVASPPTANTDAMGIATFPYVPLGATVACTTTSAGHVAAASNVAYVGPDQLVELSFPATSPLTAQLVRANPQAVLNSYGWHWAIAPGSDMSSPEPVNALSAFFPDLYQGSTQSVAATLYLNDNLWASAPAAWNSHNATWTAASTQAIGQSAANVTLTLPVRASAQFLFQDVEGRPIAGSMLGDSLTVKVKQSTNPGLMGNGYWIPPASRTFSDFDGVTMPEVFTEGVHVLSLTSALWGDLPDAVVTVGPLDDGKLLPVSVTLDWLKTSYRLRALGGDGLTPVVNASLAMKTGAWDYSSIGVLTASSPDGILSDAEAVEGSFYAPRGKQIQFGGGFSTDWRDAEGIYHWIDTGWIDGTSHTAGDVFDEAIVLPLTVVQARLTDTDGVTSIEPFAAEFVKDQPLPMVRIQGVAYAALMGSDPGPVRLALYDPHSGLGATVDAVVPPLGQTGTAQIGLPPYLWMSQASLQSADAVLLTDPLWVGVGADSPGLVKPGLALWSFDSSQTAPWQSLASLQYGPQGQITYASGFLLTSSGFFGPQNSGGGSFAASRLPSLALQGRASAKVLTPLRMNGYSRFNGQAKVRIPLQGTVWLGSGPSGWDGALVPGPVGYQAYSLNAEDTFAPVVQAPVRTWVDVPFTILDGAGNPHVPSGLALTPLHAPYGWFYAGTSDGSQPLVDWDTGAVNLNLPQGETLRVETANPWCGQWWYGSLNLTVPTPVPSIPYLLNAAISKPSKCGE